MIDGNYLRHTMADKLIDCCTREIDDFRPLATSVQETADGPAMYIDNGGDVLAVAHLDFVDWTKPHFRGSKIYCPQLDDRLGVFVLLHVLPALGVKVDVLLTDSEEVGRSTAKDFVPPKGKEWNWIFQFDRRGTDVVLYDYDSKRNRKRLRQSGFEVGQGTFSDICYLDSLGVSGWNIGTGYHHEHTRRCFADLNDTARNAVTLAAFWHRYHETKIVAPWIASGKKRETTRERREREERELVAYRMRWESERLAETHGGWSLDRDDWNRPPYRKVFDTATTASKVPGRIHELTDDEYDVWEDDRDGSQDFYDLAASARRERLEREALDMGCWDCICGEINDIQEPYCVECGEEMELSFL